jgi:hypothetical protein
LKHPKNGGILVPSFDWRWKISEAVERLRVRYDLIGRSTGAPFLALIYPPETEKAFECEWQTIGQGLAPDFEVKNIDVLRCTADIMVDIGAGNIINALADPMPGSDPASDLAGAWESRIVEAVQNAVTGAKRPIVVLHKLGALYPVAGPREIMQSLWDSPRAIDFPVVFLIPGHISSARTYSFLGQREEFMYRGDLL